jgi:hypothetical protein
MAKEIEYTVRGHWPFPTDMLRHDGSRPATEADRLMIDRLSQDFAPDRDVFRDVEIKLVGPNKQNTARWESFGWQVPADKEHAWLKRVQEQDRSRRTLIAGAVTKLTPDELDALKWAGLRA